MPAMCKMEKDACEKREEKDMVEVPPGPVQNLSSTLDNTPSSTIPEDWIAVGACRDIYGSLEKQDDDALSSPKMECSVSIRMPLTSNAESLENPRKVSFANDVIGGFESFDPSAGADGSRIPSEGKELQDPSVLGKLKDKRFDSFKTWSGKHDKHISNLAGNPIPETLKTHSESKNSVAEALPVDRYFDALDGPELDNLKPSEEIMLPKDKTWPFLLRFPVSSFGICLGLSSQAIMWKALATSASTKFLHISLNANLILWCISVALIITIASIYSLKVILYFEAVRREYYHPIRVNFFFAPWIALLFLAIGIPPSLIKHLQPFLWYILMTPIFCLEVKIYGQWMSGGQRRLSKVANPSNHLSVVGNFVGALLGAAMGLKEGPIFFFAVGLAHYTVLFVTLYQRLPTNETLPKDLHPVFFLFVAAPSVASMAWANIQGSFNFGSRIAYFIALFLYLSLAVRVNFFRGFKFSLTWWAYTFPMTGAAIATIRYSNEVTNVVTRILALILCTVSTLTVTSLLVTTIIHAFVLRDLFPNDIAIAISNRKPKQHRHLRWFHMRNGSSDFFTSSTCDDLEAATKDNTSLKCGKMES